MVVGVGGSLVPADPTTFSVQASSATISGPISSEELTCRGPVDIGGAVTIGGGITVKKEVELGGGMDARGTHIANALLEHTSFRGAVQGNVEFDGDVRISTMKSGGGDIIVSAGGELRVATGVEFNHKEGVLVVGKVSGHKVSTASHVPVIFL